MPTQMPTPEKTPAHISDNILALETQQNVLTNMLYDLDSTLYGEETPKTTGELNKGIGFEDRLETLAKRNEFLLSKFERILSRM